MDEARQKADEFCSCRHLERTILGPAGASEIAAMLGFPELDSRWCTPWGVDVTYLCGISRNEGDFGSLKWSINGWILDDYSMQALREEFPDKFLKRRKISLGPT